MAPIAPVLLLGQASLAVNPSQEIACLQPVHLHATRDHLILMSQNQINLTESESSELLKTAIENEEWSKEKEEKKVKINKTAKKKVDSNKNISFDQFESEKKLY